MNPFSEIIDNSRRPSIIYSPSTVNKLVDNMRSDSGDSYFTDAQSTPVERYKSSAINGGKSVENGHNEANVEVEVQALLRRLRELVGDVNVQPIIEQLNTQKRNGAQLTHQPLCLDDEHLPPVPVPTKQKQTKTAHFAMGTPQARNAHFAMGTPLVRHEKTPVVDSKTEIPLFDDSESAEDTSEKQAGKYSRYSLGLNRFSKRASLLSSDTLNYVSGNKLLRTTTRSSLLSPDPYACLSPAGKLVKSQSLSSMPNLAENLSAKNIEFKPKVENFQEFCTIGVQSDMLFGLKPLETTSLQPTEVSCLFPTNLGRIPIVSNLNEYCFPYGAELRYVTRKELDVLNAISSSDVNAEGTAFHNSAQSYGLKYQIMQFTDIGGTVYYATCVISTEPVELVSPALHANMDALQNNIAASNIIKRYLAFFVHRKKMRLNQELNARWVSNMTKSRVQSMVSSGGTGTDDTSADSKGTKTANTANTASLFKTIKRVIGVSFKPPKLGMHKVISGLDLDVQHKTPGKGAATSTNMHSSTSPSVQTKKGPVASPMSSPAAPSPLLRQRSRSFCHNSPPASVSRTSCVYGEVHVDGSPNKSKSAAKKLEFSNRKVALITQKAYCIISNQPLHPLFFQVLEAIALKQRDRALMRWSCLSNNSGGTALAARDSHKDGMFKDMIMNQVADSAAASVCAYTVKRNKFLAQLQALDLSRINKATEARRSVMSYNGKLIDIADQSYITTLKIMPRALTLREWTSAILISLIPSELIVKIHSLLLQEQSLLVYGEDAGMVTAIATAFMLLLQPFTWEGIFVPLLPTAAYEALDAPVPYIIGVVAKSRPTATISANAGVLSLDDFIRHPEFYVPSCFDEATLRHTLATREDPNLQLRRSRARHEMADDANMGLKYFECPCPEESAQGVSPLLDPMQCSQLKELHQLIAYHAVKIKVCLRSVQNSRITKVLNSTTAIKAVLNNLNDEALRSLTNVLSHVHAYNSSLCGEVLTQPGGWRQFGVLNSRSHQFEFLPDLFMAPLKANLRLQESVINTQLFVSFMDQQSEAYVKLQPQRVFISDWLYFRLHRKRRANKRRTARLHLY